MISMCGLRLSQRGGRILRAQKVIAQTTALFKVRYNTSITTLHRIKYGTKIFEILSINDVDAKHEELQISAKEVI
jgi:SPP1 family predicted phage head-tail adaptor